MTVLEKIDGLRKARGWSVNYLAMEAMLTQSTLNNLYTRKAEPKLSTLRALCDAFGITLSEFFADESELNSADEELVMLVRTLPPEQKRALSVWLKSLR